MTQTARALGKNEPHPAALTAKAWLESLPKEQYNTWRNAFKKVADEGNRLGEVCYETMNRIEMGATINDRYLLGLAFSILAVSMGTDPEQEAKDNGEESKG